MLRALARARRRSTPAGSSSTACVLDDGARHVRAAGAATGRRRVPGLPAVPAPQRARERRVRAPRSRRRPGRGASASRGRVAGDASASPITPAPGPRALSGGQAQRVALARALAIDAAPAPARRAARRARRSRRGSRCGVTCARRMQAFDGMRILVTHDPVDAATLADRLVDPRARSRRPDRHARRDHRPPAVGVRRRARRASTCCAGRARAIASSSTAAVSSSPRRRRAARCSRSCTRTRSRCTRPTPSGSARNVWTGPVESIEPLGDRVRVRVGGTVPLIAEITPAALARARARRGAAGLDLGQGHRRHRHPGLRPARIVPGRAVAPVASPAVDSASGTLFVILVIAFLAPLAAGFTTKLMLPALVFEIFLGVIVGPSVLGLVKITDPISLLSDLGPLGADLPRRLRARPPARPRASRSSSPTTGWLISVGLGVAAGFALQADGRHPDRAVRRARAHHDRARHAAADRPRRRPPADEVRDPRARDRLAGEFGPIIAIAVVLSGASAGAGRARRCSSSSRSRSAACCSRRASTRRGSRPCSARRCDRAGSSTSGSRSCSSR